MIPTLLKIRGFLSYNDPVEIDFTGFDMACISGSNGAGKSSILDAITWVLFGEARRRDDAVINQRTKHGASVTLEFEYEGSVYRVVRSKLKDRSTTLDFYIKIKEDTFKSLSLSTMRGTEEYIQQTLHLDYETFINTAFFLQGKADQFAQQKPSDRKRILASILRLDIWEVYKEEAVARRRLLENGLSVCRSKISSIDETLAEEDERNANYNTLAKQHALVSQLMKSNKELLDKQRFIANQYAAEKSQLSKQYIELKRLRLDLDAKEEVLHARITEHDGYAMHLNLEDTIRKGYKELQEYQRAFEDYNAAAILYHKYSSERDTVLTKIESKRSILQSKIKSLEVQYSDIKELEENCNRIHKEIVEFEQKIALYEEQQQEVTKLNNDLQDISVQNIKIVHEISHINKEIETLILRKTSLQESDESMCPTCEKPLSAVELSHILVDIDSEIAKLKQTKVDNEKTQDKITHREFEMHEQLHKIGDIDTIMKQLHRTHDSNSDTLKRYQEEVKVWDAEGALILKNLKLELEYEEYAKEENKELDKITNKMNDIEYDEDNHLLTKLNIEEYKHFQDDLNKLEQAKSALMPIEREIKNLEKSIDDAKELLEQREEEYNLLNTKLANVAGNDQDLVEIERNYKESQDKVDELLKELGSAQAQIDILEDLKTQKKISKIDEEKILVKITQIKVLEKAFGKDGIPTLLIEQALPEIEEHANEILDRLSGGTMEISFETQRDFKDAKRQDKRDTLDIMITSSSEERAYELLSGGEAFRINFAIRLALSRILANRAGARLSTLVIDEGFGSQDAEGRQRLIEAINSVRLEFDKILVITHLDELKDVFSARIEVSKHVNGSQVEVVLA
jgi:exonuclease SbcC